MHASLFGIALTRAYTCSICNYSQLLPIAMTPANSLIDTLKARGYRLTPQREMILDVLDHSTAHLTAEDVFEAVGQRTRAMNIATVYRTLELLVEEGLVSRIDVGGGSVRYATAGHGSHVHLVCRHCHQTFEADYALVAPLAAKLLREHGFEADLGHVSLFGTCGACRSRDPRTD